MRTLGGRGVRREGRRPSLQKMLMLLGSLPLHVVRYATTTRRERSDGALYRRVDDAEVVRVVA